MNKVALLMMKNEYDVYFPFYRNVFSQWHSCRFKVDGVRYNCAEQYMMAQKARLFGDKKSEAKIMSSRTPAEQKELGRHVRGFDKKIWNMLARDCVTRANLAKFSASPDLRSQLISTEGKLLVEASPNDTLRGVGLSLEDPRIHDRTKWQGKNWLGQILTEIRDAWLVNVFNPTRVMFVCAKCVGDDHRSPLVLRSDEREMRERSAWPVAPARLGLLRNGDSLLLINQTV